jgi:hypothetical protein
MLRHTIEAVGFATTQKIDNPLINQWYDFTSMMTLPSTATGTIRHDTQHFYSSSGVQTGKVMQVDNKVAINLTEAFGAGNEPTQAEMDAIMVQFENSWFDGTVNRNNEVYTWKLAMQDGELGFLIEEVL